MSKVVVSGYLNVMFLFLLVDGIVLGVVIVLVYIYLIMIVFIVIMLYKVRLCFDIFIGLNELLNLVYVLILIKEC